MFGKGGGRGFGSLRSHFGSSGPRQASLPGSSLEDNLATEFGSLRSHFILSFLQDYMAIIEDATVAELVGSIGNLGLWIQGVGLLVIFWIVTGAITMYFNRKRRFLLMDIDARVERIEKQLARLEKHVVKKR